MINKNYDKSYKESDRKLNYAESLAIRMVKGQKLRLHEKLLLAERYPDLKAMAKRAIEDNEKLKEIIKKCKDENEVQRELSKATIKVKVMEKSGFITEAQKNIKIAAIKETKKL